MSAEMADALFVPSTLQAGPPLWTKPPVLITDTFGSDYWWRPPGYDKSRSAHAPPSVAMEDFSVVSWVRQGGRSTTQWWADTRGWDGWESRGASWPTGEKARGWVVGIHQGNPLLQMNTGDLEKLGKHGWSGDSYWSQGQSVVDGTAHCIVFSCKRSERNGVSLYIDGQLVWSGKDAYEHRKVDLAGTQLLVGTGKDALAHPAKQFDGQLYLLGLAPGALDADQCQQLTDEMHRQLAAWEQLASQPVRSRREPAPSQPALAERSTVFGYDAYVPRDHEWPLEINPAPAIGTGDFTVSAWVQRRTLSHRKYLGETRGATSGAAARGWLFGFYDERLLVQVNGGDQGRWHNFLSESVVPASDRWTMVSVRVRREGHIDFFIGGELAGRADFPTELTNVDLAGAALQLGRSLDANSEFDGELGCLLVVQGAMADEQIAALSRRGFDERHVTAHYRQIVAAPVRTRL